MPHLQIFIVSIRPSRKGPLVAAWFERQARQHGGFEIEVVDLAEVNLPMMNEPEHPRLRRYQHDHTKAWSARISKADAFVFVTPEYNFSSPPSLVNALDYLVHEWAYKAAGFVSYGGISGGLRSVQMTKLLLTSLKVVPLYESVAIPLFANYLDSATGAFSPGETQEKAAVAMLDELARWTAALSALRAPVAG
jgi:NAD(P)H-dependent FMN reductase